MYLDAFVVEMKQTTRRLRVCIHLDVRSFLRPSVLGRQGGSKTLLLVLQHTAVTHVSCSRRGRDVRIRSVVSASS